MQNNDLNFIGIDVLVSLKAGFILRLKNMHEQYVHNNT